MEGKKEKLGLATFNISFPFVNWMGNFVHLGPQSCGCPAEAMVFRKLPSSALDFRVQLSKNTKLQNDSCVLMETRSSVLEVFVWLQVVNLFHLYDRVGGKTNTVLEVLGFRLVCFA